MSISFLNRVARLVGLIVLLIVTIPLEAQQKSIKKPKMTNPAENTAEIVEQILKLERDIMDAITRKDPAALAQMVRDDFTYRTHFGAAATKTEFLQSIASFPMEIVSIRGEELNVDVFGETAILTGIQRAEARPPEAQPEESVVAFTDVFVRSEGRWLMVLAFGVELPTGSGFSELA